MPHTRADSQTVEAFSLNKDLLVRAKRRAVELKMSKSGYFRYCLALELGHPEPEAREIAAHGAVQALRETIARTEITRYPRRSLHPNTLNQNARAHEAMVASDAAEKSLPKSKHK